jgi:phage terminase large subunit
MKPELLAAAILAANRSRRAWTDDPVIFCRDALGVELWDLQAEVARAIATCVKVAVRSGHKIGKTKLAACIAIWWAFTRPRGRVVITAPTFHQVKDLIWHEIVSVLLGTNLDIPSPPKDPSTGIKWADGRYIIGMSTDKPENIAGFSGDQLLFLVDEASGVDERIFEALNGNMAGGARMLMIGNPTQTSGTFYGAFHDNARFWERFHISSEQTPNVVSGEIVVRGLATRAWIEERKQEWGEGSPLYDIRVRGDFPSQGSNAVIGLALVEAAKARWVETTGPSDPTTIGVDVARFGDDDSVMAVLRGNRLVDIEAVHGFDVVAVAGKVLELARKHRAMGQRRTIIKVDTIGVGGGVADILRQHKGLVEVFDVNVSEAATCEGYSKLRDQLWFSLADWLQTGAIKPDGKLEAELVTPTYSFDLQGRQRVEPKDKIKERIGRSPDRADALALAVYNAAPSRILPPRPRSGRWGDNARGFG